LRLKI